MKATEYQQDAAADQLASELSEGLKNCRAILNDYRSRLSGSPAAEQHVKDPARQQRTL